MITMTVPTLTERNWKAVMARANDREDRETAYARDLANAIRSAAEKLMAEAEAAESDQAKIDLYNRHAGMYDALDAMREASHIRFDKYRRLHSRLLRRLGVPGYYYAERGETEVRV
jgi:hypothetical protein